MTRSKMLSLVAVLAAVALCICGQQAQAEVKNHTKYKIKVIPHGGPNAALATPASLADGLYGVSAVFAYTAYPTLNSDTSDIWPCFSSGGTGPAGTATSDENPDCPTIGDPKIPFPAGGVAVGAYSYSWPLSACNATSTSTPVCGETETWYEDDSNDTSATDELLYTLEAVQGTNVLYDSGTVDFGPNPYGGASPADDIVIYGPQNFGNMGITAGPNNGNCSAAYNYPLSSAANPGAVYIVPANKTCGVPTTGLVSFTATTEIGSPAYTKVTKGTVDGTPCSVAAPCYETKWTKKYSVAQKWSIYFY
jgi:hypothetical protein